MPSLKMMPFDRPYTTSYWSAIVSIALRCTILSYLTLNNIVTLMSRLEVTQGHWKCCNGFHATTAKRTFFLASASNFSLSMSLYVSSSVVILLTRSRSICNSCATFVSSCISFIRSCCSLALSDHHKQIKTTISCYSWHTLMARHLMFTNVSPSIVCPAIYCPSHGHISKTTQDRSTVTMKR